MLCIKCGKWINLVEGSSQPEGGVILTANDVNVSTTGVHPDGPTGPPSVITTLEVCVCNGCLLQAEYIVNVYPPSGQVNTLAQFISDLAD